MNSVISRPHTRPPIGLLGATLVVALVALTSPAGAQEKEKKVPKNSVRVSIPGCSNGALFLAGRASEDQPGGNAVPEGTRMRMLGPRALMREIKGQEGSRIEITGLMKKGQQLDRGIAVGRGVRVGGGGSGPAAPLGGGVGGVSVGSPAAGQLTIDVEGWRRIPGDCPR
ncbi:MAG: hypothetical protein AB7N65_29380 [Vicinamibacterales bacterium]